MAVTNKNYSRNTLLGKIHVAKAQLKLSDDDYRAVLSNWRYLGQGDVITSASNMTCDQMVELLKVFEEKFGWKAQSRKKQKKFIKPSVEGERDSAFATTAQLEKINLLWIKHSTQKDEESLRKFAKRILHVDLMQSIQANQVHILVKAIENLARGKSFKKEGE
jgi:hypothetical protein